MAGGDVKSFQEITDPPPAERRRRFLDRIHGLHPLMTIMRRMPQPILASVRGAAAGAGVSMALNCDLVIAAESAFFTLAYRHIGLSPDGGATFHLPRAVGVKKAMEIALLGERFSAAQAMEWGMINKVLPEEQLTGGTLDWALRIATGPTRALGLTKGLLRGSLAASMAEQLQAEAEAFAESTTTEDWVEGVRAFNEKRPARFKGE